jgi:hypothetical protein
MEGPKCHADHPDTYRFRGNRSTPLTRDGQLPMSPTKILETPVHARLKGNLAAGEIDPERKEQRSWEENEGG